MASCFHVLAVHINPTCYSRGEDHMICQNISHQMNLRLMQQPSYPPSRLRAVLLPVYLADCLLTPSGPVHLWQMAFCHTHLGEILIGFESLQTMLLVLVMNRVTLSVTSASFLEPKFSKKAGLLQSTNEKGHCANTIGAFSRSEETMQYSWCRPTESSYASLCS